MSSAARLDPMPAFPEFYEALNKRSPFPWQARLAEQVAQEQRWPTEIGVPTGLGKTTCLDIAVWWLASQAGRLPHERTAPTRIWWLVNRRLLVDSTADHAQRLSDALRDSSVSALRTVGQRLRSMAAIPSSSPIDVIRLRGGVDAPASGRSVQARHTAIHHPDVRVAYAVSRIRNQPDDAPHRRGIGGS